jgi:hypothetical protein
MTNKADWKYIKDVTPPKNEQVLLSVFSDGIEQRHTFLVLGKFIGGRGFSGLQFDDDLGNEIDYAVPYAWVELPGAADLPHHLRNNRSIN